MVHFPLQLLLLLQNLIIIYEHLFLPQILKTSLYISFVSSKSPTPLLLDQIDRAREKGKSISLKNQRRPNELPRSEGRYRCHRGRILRRAGGTKTRTIHHRRWRRESSR
ncbi:hypothetical protein QJS04_geneDACA014482 [Acorus gramineus]|uniref:Uncharacterized protein n=1 Tax=Acorus gramineus TaxID=55184 RepID=A0AAV9BMJ6_ACOGR|nr:hypothetical protein QJS04_geneDACA014482 [Acorus gramineus]